MYARTVLCRFSSTYKLLKSESRSNRPIRPPRRREYCNEKQKSPLRNSSPVNERDDAWRAPKEPDGRRNFYRPIRSCREVTAIDCQAKSASHICHPWWKWARSLIYPHCYWKGLTVWQKRGKYTADSAGFLKNAKRFSQRLKTIFPRNLISIWFWNCHHYENLNALFAS